MWTRLITALVLSVHFLLGGPVPERSQRKMPPQTRESIEIIQWVDRQYNPVSNVGVLSYVTNIYSNRSLFDSNGFLTESVTFDGWTGNKSRVLLDRDGEHWVTNREFFRNDRFTGRESTLYSNQYRDAYYFSDFANSSRGLTLHEVFNDQGKLVEKEEIYRGQPQSTRRFYYQGTNLARIEVIENRRVTFFQTNELGTNGQILRILTGSGKEKGALRNQYVYDPESRLVQIMYFETKEKSICIQSNSYEGPNLTREWQRGAADFDEETHFSYEPKGWLVKKIAYNLEWKPGFAFRTSTFEYKEK